MAATTALGAAAAAALGAECSGVTTGDVGAIGAGSPGIVATTVLGAPRLQRSARKPRASRQVAPARSAPVRPGIAATVASGDQDR